MFISYATLYYSFDRYCTWDYLHRDFSQPIITMLVQSLLLLTRRRCECVHRVQKYGAVAETNNCTAKPEQQSSETNTPTAMARVQPLMRPVSHGLVRLEWINWYVTPNITPLTRMTGSSRSLRKLSSKVLKHWERNTYWQHSQDSGCCMTDVPQTGVCISRLWVTVIV